VRSACFSHRPLFRAAGSLDWVIAPHHFGALTSPRRPGDVLLARSMQYLWIGIIVATAAPLLYVAWLANPFVIVILGRDPWLERVARLAPYRWWILFLMVVCAFSVAVYTIRFG
jgi:hypothetical protein